MTTAFVPGRLRGLAALLAVALLTGAVAAQDAPPLPDPDTLDDNQIVAQVNSEVITSYDVLKRISPVLDPILADPSIPVAEKRSVWRELFTSELKKQVNQTLARQLGQAAGIVVEQEFVEKRIEERAEDVNGLPRLVQLLSERGMDLDDLRESIETDEIMRSLMLQQVGLVPGERSPMAPLDSHVSPADMRAYYDKHRDEFTSEEGVKVSMIRIRKGRRSQEEEKRALMEKIRARAVSGVPFDTLAREFSESRTRETGGKMNDGDWMDRGQLSPELEQAFWSLPAGGISAVVETEQPPAFWMFRVDEKMVASVEPYEAVQPRIRARLQQQRVEENFERVYRRMLKEAYIWPPGLFDDEGR